MVEQVPLDDAAADFLRPTLKLDRFFPSRLTVKSLRMLFPHSGLYRYGSQQYIIRQGDASKDLHIIEAGQVEITKTLGTAGVHIATLGRGDIFGEMALITDDVRIANAVAQSDCLIFRLEFLDVQALVAGNPELAEHLQGLAAERSRQ